MNKRENQFDEDLENDPTIYFYAMSFVGKPYKWGGTGPIGFDCSGLVIEILKSAGVLPNAYDNNAQGLFNHFTDSDNGSFCSYPRFGGIAFYGKSKNCITHVAFCIDSRVIEAGGGGSRTITPEDAERQGAMVRVRPYNYRKDLQSIIVPEGAFFL